MKTRQILIFGIMLIMLTLLLTLAGCGKSPENLVEDTVESLIEAENESIEASNEAIESNSENSSDSEESTGTQVEYSETFEWPDELPGHIPPLEGVISFDNADGNDMNAYIELLLANGWSIDMQTELPDAWIVQAHRGDSEFINAGVELEENSGMINVTLPD
jgi:hypothetical protein